MSLNEQRVPTLPIWQSQITWRALPGGLSNESYLVTDQQGERFVVRFGQDYPFHHVSREREVMIAKAANAAGFGPAVIYNEPGVMVSTFIEGKTLDASDVQQNIGAIAALVRQFHNELGKHVSGPAYLFWVFHVVRDYARTLEAGNSRFRQQIPRYLALADRFAAVQVPLPITFGHHDLLPANFIDDGQRLWLIDFEYAGFSTAMFDLAGIASNAGFDAAQAAQLLEAYFVGPVGNDVSRSHAAMQCASLLREAMWSMVSELYLETPGIDFEAYTQENLDSLMIAIDSYDCQFGKD